MNAIILTTALFAALPNLQIDGGGIAVDTQYSGA